MADGTCSRPGCDRAVFARNICQRHYSRWRASGTMPPARSPKSTECRIDGCSKAVGSRGLCPMHYERWRVHGDPMHETWTRICTVDGCVRAHKSDGYCTMHYSRWKRRGDIGGSAPLRPLAHAPHETCAASGCANYRTKRQWCDMHYRRWLKHGAPEICLNEWAAPAAACLVCGRTLLANSGSRRFCSAACSAIARRTAQGEATFLNRQNCTSCGVPLELEIVGGFRRRGNGLGLCWPCADKSPCHRCGQPRTRSGKRLACLPCERPQRTADAQRRRAMARGALCEHGPNCVTAAVMRGIRRSNCFYCNNVAAHADHFIPLARGGKHCRDNLVAACQSCNLAKSDNDPWEWWERTDKVGTA